jgi:hypothetical protein
MLMPSRPVTVASKLPQSLQPQQTCKQQTGIATLLHNHHRCVITKICCTSDVCTFVVHPFLFTADINAHCYITIQLEAGRCSNENGSTHFYEAGFLQSKELMLISSQTGSP